MSDLRRSPRDGRFATTRWSLVLSAGKGAGQGSEQALAQLCELYWYPVYAFIRRHGHSSDEAADLTQEFFALVLEKSYLRAADPERGRFRSFLLACLRHFLSNQRDRATAIKRGGGYNIVPLEIETAEGRYLHEPPEEITPEKIFERRWALTLLDRVLARLGDEYNVRGRQKLFEVLKGFLTGDSADVSYQAVAQTLGTTEGAVKVAVHRLRRRFRDLLAEEVETTVANQHDVEDEIRYLLRAVSV